jgi:P-loop containing dynein motor region D4
LLIGVGGSGKKSLVTVACAMSKCNMAMIEPTKDYKLKEFRKDLFEKMLHKAGV